MLEDYPLANTEFNKMHGVKLLQFGVPGNKEPFVDIPEEGIAAALTAVLGMEPNYRPNGYLEHGNVDVFPPLLLARQAQSPHVDPLQQRKGEVDRIIVCGV